MFCQRVPKSAAGSRDAEGKLEEGSTCCATHPPLTLRTSRLLGCRLSSQTKQMVYEHTYKSNQKQCKARLLLRGAMSKPALTPKLANSAGG